MLPRSFSAFVSALGRGWSPNFADIDQLAGFEADLSDERDGTFGANDLIPPHRRIEYWRQNAGSLVGVRENLQQLLRGDGHMGS